MTSIIECEISLADRNRIKLFVSLYFCVVFISMEVSPSVIGYIESCDFAILVLAGGVGIRVIYRKRSSEQLNANHNFPKVLCQEFSGDECPRFVSPKTSPIPHAAWV